jgi:molecular chaperone GrpE
MTEPIQSETPTTTIPTTPTPAPAATPPPPMPTDASQQLEAQLATAKQEAAASYDRYTRAVADLENFRKRTLREKEELRLYAAAGLMEDVIPILDNLGLGLAAAKQQTEVKPIVEGITMTMDQFKHVLSRHGLKEINPTNQKFDPHFHECIAHQPSADIAEENVTQVVRLGYSLNNRLLRPASVIVSSGPAQENSA